jgi:hypothetical protein
VLSLVAGGATTALLMAGAEAEEAADGVPAVTSTVVTSQAPEATPLSLAEERGLGGNSRIEGRAGRWGAA